MRFARPDLLFLLIVPVVLFGLLFWNLSRRRQALERFGSLARKARKPIRGEGPARPQRDSEELGGVLVIEPWITPEDWRVGEPHLQTYDSPDLKLARANVARREGDWLPRARWPRWQPTLTP